MKIFAVGDIHGRLDLLTQLYAKLFNEERLDLSVDKLIFLGDMCDRGSDSKGVFDYVRTLTELHPNNVIALAGNHEWMLIDAHIKDYDWFAHWVGQGGEQTLYSFLPSTKVPESYIKWLSSLPLSHEEPGFFFSHSPLPSLGNRGFWDKHVDPSVKPWTKEELTWTRTRNVNEEEFNTYKFKGTNTVGVCGHNHALNYNPWLQVPRFYDHYIFTDAGCGCAPDAPLCAVEVKSRKVIYSYDPKYEPSTYGDA